MILGDSAKAFNARSVFICDSTNAWDAANASATGDVLSVYLMVCLEETVFSNITAKNEDLTPNSTDTTSALDSGTYPAGFPIYADIRAIAITSGKVLCYAIQLKS